MKINNISKNISVTTTLTRSGKKYTVVVDLIKNRVGITRTVGRHRYSIFLEIEKSLNDIDKNLDRILKIPKKKFLQPGMVTA